MQIGDDRIILLIQLSAMTRELDHRDQQPVFLTLSKDFPSELKASFPRIRNTED